MYKLYYSPGACSMPIHALLCELGVPFEAQKIALSEGENRKEAFLKINSLGQIPVLQDGDTIVREGAAIISYLARKHPTAWLPQSGPSAISAMEAMMFCNASLHPAYTRVFFLKKLDIDQAAKEKALEAAFAKVQDLWDDVELRLSKNKYLAGDNMTVADVMMTVMSNWAKPNGLRFGPNAQKIFAEVMNCAAYKKASEAESAPAKAAA